MRWHGLAAAREGEPEEKGDQKVVSFSDTNFRVEAQKSFPISNRLFRIVFSLLRATALPPLPAAVIHVDMHTRIHFPCAYTWSFPYYHTHTLCELLFGYQLQPRLISTFQQTRSIQLKRKIFRLHRIFLSVLSSLFPAPVSLFCSPFPLEYCAEVISMLFQRNRMS